MENASKVLYMAAEILIALLILGLIAFLIMIFGNFSRNMNSQIQEDKVSSFNLHFFNLSERIDITAQEIASIINYAKENNDSYEADYNNSSNSPYYVDVIIDDTSFFNDTSLSAEKNKENYENKATFKQKLNNFIRANNTKLFCVNVTRAEYVSTKDTNQLNDIKVVKYKEQRSYDSNDIEHKKSDILINSTSGQVIKIWFTSSSNVVKNLPSGVNFDVTTRDQFTINGV